MKKIISLICVLAMTFSLFGCSSAEELFSQVVVKYSVVFPATGAQADGANELGKLIEECSDGGMKMEFYPSSQLGDKVATFESLQAGTIEMSECAATDLTCFNDMWSVFSLPYLWDSGMQAINTVMDPKVREMLETDAEENGLIIIAWTDLGSRNILNKKHTVNSPEDLDGLKLRCMEDTILAESVNAMGAIGTPMAFGEVYTALQQGTIDGLDHTPSGVVSNGWEELCKYYSLTEHFTIPDPIFVSKVWFERLSDENQAALLEAGEKFTEKWNNEIWPSATEESLKVMKEAGVEVTEVDKEPFKESVQGIIDQFLENADEDQKALYELLIDTKDKYK